MNSHHKEVIITYYCRNNMKKLKALCRKKVRTVCGDSNKDEDDLYSIAVDVLMKVVDTYEEGHDCKFESYLSSCINKKMDTYIRDNKYRYKRSNIQKDKDEEGNDILVHIPNISLDKPSEDGVDIIEKIPSTTNVDNELFDKIGFSFDDKVEKYIKELPIKVQKVALLICQAYEKSDIIRILNIEEKQYLDAIKTMRQSEYTSILF